MTFPDCFIGAYAGWSASEWVVAVVASALAPILISLPFWYRRDRGFGAMSIFGFVGFISIYGLVPCSAGIPIWVVYALAAAVLGVVMSMFVTVLKGGGRQHVI